MFYRVLALTICLFFSQITLAKLPPKPVSCPDKAVIFSAGLTMAEPVSNRYYFAYHLSNYQTKTPWAFVIVPVEGDSPINAIHNANTLLPKMTGNPNPEITSDHDGWLCSYQLPDPEMLAAAVTSEDMPSIRRIVSSIRR